MSVVGAVRTLVGLDDRVVIHRLVGARRALRVSAGLAAAGGAGHAAWLIAGPRQADPRTDPKRFLPAAAGVGVAMALLGTSLLLPNRSAPVLGRFAGLDEAVRAADEVNRATGVVRRGPGDHVVVDLQQHYDLDDQALAKLRVGDGSVRFEALVTRDGDLLMPTGDTTRGYANSGAAKAPLDLDGLDPADPDALEAALLGQQVGTDRSHAALRLGKLAGSRAGYATAEDAAKDVYRLRGPEHAMVQVRDRWFALTLEGPPSRIAAARGTSVGPLANLHVQDTAGLFAAKAPGTLFTFERRIAPFDSREPLGRTLYLFDHEGTPVAHEGTHATEAEAAAAAERLGRMSNHWDGYGVLEAPSSKGGHHVYRLGGDAYRGWDDDLGPVRAVQMLAQEKQRVRDGGGQRINFQSRDTLEQVNRRREYETVRTSNWTNDHFTDDPDRTKPPTTPGQVLPGW